MSDDTKQTHYQDQALTVRPSARAPAPYTYPMHPQLAPSIARIEAMTEVGRQGMQVLSDVVLMTMKQATADAQITHLILRGLAASEQPTAEAQATLTTIQQRFANHLARLRQITDAVDLAIMRTITNA